MSKTTRRGFFRKIGAGAIGGAVGATAAKASKDVVVENVEPVEDYIDSVRRSGLLNVTVSIDVSPSSSWAEEPGDG